MINKVLLIILIALLVILNSGCSSDKLRHKEIVKVKIDKIQDTKVANESKKNKYKSDIIRVDKLTVQGLPVFNFPIKSLFDKLGEPDSIFGIIPEPLDIQDDVVYYYKNSTYQSTRDSKYCSLEKIEFRPGIEIVLDELILSQNTTLEDIRQHYPWSYKNMDKIKDGSGDDGIRFMVEMENGQLTDSVIILRFRESKLNQFLYWYDKT